MGVSKYFLSSVITGMIIIILLVVGEVSALGLFVQADRDHIFKGGKIHFTMDVDMSNNDPSISSLFITINGSTNESCSFRPDGRAIGRCKGFKVVRSGDFGYGYGYDPSVGGKRTEYIITFDSSSFNEGDYDIIFGIHAGNNTLSRLKKITIDTNLRCSVRADDGTSSYNNTNFSKSKLSFFISNGNANKGSGTLTLQDKKKRFTFSFKAGNVEILSHNSTMLLLNVTGKGKLNREDIPLTNALLTLDKQNKKVSLQSSDGLNVKNMDVTFMKEC